MPNSKKQKIYIAIILVCFLATGGILYYGFFSSSGTPPPPPSGTPVADTQTDTTASVTPTQGDSTSTFVNGTPVYNSPSVFPNDTQFDFTLLNSDKFKSLNSIPNLTLGPVGKDNPFSQ